MKRRYHAALYALMLEVDYHLLHCRWSWWCERMNHHQDAAAGWEAL